jgi:hypothetical protein
MVVMNCFIIVIELNQIILLESSSVCPNLRDLKTLMHTLNGKNDVIKFSRCMISLTGGISTLLPSSFQAMHSLGGIKLKRTSLYWGVLILILGLR